MPELKHSEFCRCQLCMKTRITEAESEAYKSGIQSTMVDRRNPDDPHSPLMKSSAVDAIIHAGQSVDMLAATGIQADTLPSAYDYPLTDPEELTIQAKWKHRSQEAARSGRDASVFGQLGVLLVPKDFSVVDIPKMNALAIPKAFLEKYGATLIPLKEKVPIEPELHKGLETLYLVQYDFDPRYVEKYVLHPKGGGGLFVETHPFPQIFTPLSNECKGAIILGVSLGNNQFSFTGIEIPYGFTLKINSNVIHGDSYFIGPYAIALTETDLADSVLFKQDTPEREVQTVVQHPIMPAKLPILAEYRLAQAVNHLMMIDKIKHEGAVGKDFTFFQNLPTDVLQEVHGLSEEAEKAFQERQKYR